MSKKQRNKDTRPGASAVIADGTINAAASAVMRNPPSGQGAAQQKSAAKRRAAGTQKQDAFSIWLGRALPQLQDRLAQAVSIDVIAPPDKLKN